jgi:hypothetical protein
MSSQSAEVGRVGSNKLVYFFGALGGLLFGYDTGVIAGAILFINKDLGLSPFMSGLVVSSLRVRWSARHSPGRLPTRRAGASSSWWRPSSSL